MINIKETFRKAKFTNFNIFLFTDNKHYEVLDKIKATVEEQKAHLTIRQNNLQLFVNSGEIRNLGIKNYTLNEI